MLEVGLYPECILIVCVSFAASATVTIMIDDINDHSPRFVQSVYSATMSESLTRGASIISVSATDRDIGSNAKLVYTLHERDREHFYISSIEATNTGVLKVFKVTEGERVYAVLDSFGCFELMYTMENMQHRFLR